MATTRKIPIFQGWRNVLIWVRLIIARHLNWEKSFPRYNRRLRRGAGQQHLLYLSGYEWYAAGLEQPTVGGGNKINDYDLIMK